MEGVKRAENCSQKINLNFFFKSHKNMRVTLDFLKHKCYIKAYSEMFDPWPQKDH